MIEEVTAGCSQPYASRKTHQQLSAKLRFELLDVTRQRRLRDADLVRRTRDTSLIGDFHEVLDAAQFHVFAATERCCQTITNRHVRSTLSGLPPLRDLATAPTAKTLHMPNQHVQHSKSRLATCTARCSNSPRTHRGVARRNA